MTNRRLKIVFSVRDITDLPVHGVGHVLDPNASDVEMSQTIIELDVDDLSQVGPTKAKEQLEAAGALIGRYIAIRLAASRGG